MPSRTHLPSLVKPPHPSTHRHTTHVSNSSDRDIHKINCHSYYVHKISSNDMTIHLCAFLTVAKLLAMQAPSVLHVPHGTSHATAEINSSGIACWSIVLLPCPVGAMNAQLRWCQASGQHYWEHLDHPPTGLTKAVFYICCCVPSLTPCDLTATSAAGG